ncbi:protein FAM162B [Brachyhypopomus gauderio]|uniref:protein FAM162B n=1 Tax=Brachyhypopomus gauderio TaxID=698409 RepID=UPI004043834C
MIFNAIRRSFVGPWRRAVLNTVNRRQLCNKVHEEAPLPAHTQQHAFKLPGFRPSNMDKKFLIWSGRFKTVEEIPEFVSYETIDKARNKMRVRACYVMIGVTLIGCVAMIFLGKEAARHHVNLTSMNMEKKAQWRQDVQQDQLRLAAHAEKPQ